MDYFKRTRISKILLDNAIPLNQNIIVLGWVRTIRESKGVAFIELNDGSCMGNLQAVLHDPAGFPALEKILTGASVRAVGKLVESPASGQKYELTVSEIELVGEADQSFPLQKKRHSFEYLREIAHLRPRTNTFGAVNRIRSKIAYAVHRFFQERGFYYIHTPIISASDAEGAGDLFRVVSALVHSAEDARHGATFVVDLAAEPRVLAAGTFLTSVGFFCVGAAEGHVHRPAQRRRDPGPRRTRGRHRLDQPARRHRLQAPRRQGSDPIPGPRQPGPLPQCLDPRVEGLIEIFSHRQKHTGRSVKDRPVSLR